MANKVIGVVVSEFNQEITSSLLAGALFELKNAGIKEEMINVCHVPGAFEIPLMAMKLLKSADCLGVICLGAVIKGDTPHFDYVCNEAARGIMDLNLRYEKPAIFGVLTTSTYEQAKARAMPWQEASAVQSTNQKRRVDNKGIDAAQALIAMLKLLNEYPLTNR